MEKHFELTDETIEVAGNTLHRIRCTRDCKWAKTGDLGGFIEKEDNLSGDAWVAGNAWVSGTARVSGTAWVYDNAQVSGNAWVSGDAQVCGDARIDCIKAHCGFDVFGSCGRHTHAYITAENKIEITCGCFRGSIEEFEAKVRKTHGDNQYAHEYLAIIYLIKIKFGLV